MKPWLAAAGLVLAMPVLIADAPAARSGTARAFYEDHRDYLRLFGERPLTALPAGALSIERLFIGHPYGGATVIRIVRMRREAIVTVSFKRYPIDVARVTDRIERRTWRIPIARLREIDALTERSYHWNGSYPHVDRPDDDICIDSTTAEYEQLQRTGYRAVDPGACGIAGDEEKLFSAWLRVARLKITRGGSYQFIQ